MNKIDMLFVRACKGPESRRRVLSVYRRFYASYPRESLNVEYAARCLFKIAEEVKPIPAHHLLEKLAPSWYGTKRDYWDRALETVITWLAITERQHLPDYVPPLAFRLRYGFSEESR
jgi:hypothetical protein